MRYLCSVLRTDTVDKIWQVTNTTYNICGLNIQFQTSQNKLQEYMLELQPRSRTPKCLHTAQKLNCSDQREVSVQNGQVSMRLLSTVARTLEIENQKYCVSRAPSTSRYVAGNVEPLSTRELLKHDRHCKHS